MSLRGLGDIFPEIRRHAADTPRLVVQRCKPPVAKSRGCWGGQFAAHAEERPYSPRTNLAAVVLARPWLQLERPGTASSTPCPHLPDLSLHDVDG